MSAVVGRLASEYPTPEAVPCNRFTKSLRLAAVLAEADAVPRRNSWNLVALAAEEADTPTEVRSRLVSNTVLAEADVKAEDSNSLVSNAVLAEADAVP